MHCPSGQSRRQRLPTPPPPLAGPSEFEPLQVLTARADGCERVGRIVVLDEVVLDSRLVALREDLLEVDLPRDRKSTRLNSSHPSISYAVFCLKKKKKKNKTIQIKKYII